MEEVYVNEVLQALEHCMEAVNEREHEVLYPLMGGESSGKTGGERVKDGKEEEDDA